jgi:AMMECR1 domain-containing protein
MALQEISRRKPFPKNRVAPEIVAAAIQMAFDRPAFGKVRASNELRKIGLCISPARYSVSLLYQSTIH